MKGEGKEKGGEGERMKGGRKRRTLFLLLLLSYIRHLFQPPCSPHPLHPMVCRGRMKVPVLQSLVSLGNQKASAGPQSFHGISIPSKGEQDIRSLSLLCPGTNQPALCSTT